MVSRLPAKHWRDYNAATAADSTKGIDVSRGEVSRLIKPNAAMLKSDPLFYRPAIEKLIGARKDGEPHAADEVAAERIRALLDANRPAYESRAKVLEKPTYSPGVGIMPANPDPNRLYGPHVHLVVQFSEGTAKPVTRVAHDPTPTVVRINGRQVQVAGTLTVHLHGESDGRTRMVCRPIAFDVAADLITRMPNDSDQKYALIIRDDRKGKDGVLKATTFEVGPMPMIAHPQ